MARIRLPHRVHGSRELNEAQDAIHATLRQISEDEEICGVVVGGLTLTTTPKAVVHGLGRKPIGWRFVDKTTAGDVYRTDWNERTITLRTAAGTVQCDLRVW